ncbi:unnamed protein product, partial [Mesorhabditis spiculigera]
MRLQVLFLLAALILVVAASERVKSKEKKKPRFDWSAFYGVEVPEVIPDHAQVYSEEKAFILPGQKPIEAPPEATTLGITKFELEETTKAHSWVSYENYDESDTENGATARGLEVQTTTATNSEATIQAAPAGLDLLEPAGQTTENEEGEAELEESDEYEEEITTTVRAKQKLKIEKISAHLQRVPGPGKSKKKKKLRKGKGTKKAKTGSPSENGKPKASDEYAVSDSKLMVDEERIRVFFEKMKGDTIDKMEIEEGIDEKKEGRLLKTDSKNPAIETSMQKPVESGEESPISSHESLAAESAEEGEYTIDSDEFVEGDKAVSKLDKEAADFLGKLDEAKSDPAVGILSSASNRTEDYEEPSASNLTSFEYELDLNGTEFEIRESFGQMRMPKSRRYRPRAFERAKLDSAFLESELMSYRVDTNETESLRELLADPLQLEENNYADSHRDFGSSFILPVLSAINYDNFTVPLIFADIPVNVRVQLNIIHLANFDSEQMEYTIDLELEMRWYDLRLRSNYSKPVLLREKSVIDRIWRPDPYFVNSKYSYFHMVSFPNFRMRITPEGLVTYTMRATLLPSCQMVFCKYPHDRQRCDLLLSSIAFPHSFVNFSWHSTPFTFKTAIALPELHINTITAETCEVESKLIRSSCLRLLFLLERDGARFIVEKYVPSTLAMMFAWVAPYVPYNYEDVRIVTPIMVLLALVQMEKDDSAIRTSYLTSMNVWFGVMKVGVKGGK